jgi:hypothetical protein
MDDQTRVFLLAAYQHLELHDQMLRDVQIVTLALRATLQELGPSAVETYAKHYLAEAEGPLKLDADAAQQSLAQLIRQLSKGGGNEN